MNDTKFCKVLNTIPNTIIYIKFKGKKYLLNKQELLQGKVIKIYAKELGGNDIVSANFYTTIKNGLLKPCEMSEKKVIDFILNLDIMR